ncbi:MAG: hypothetical protein WCJ07_04945 [Verrucomicrobiota bacterium]
MSGFGLNLDTKSATAGKKPEDSHKFKTMPEGISTNPMSGELIADAGRRQSLKNGGVKKRKPAAVLALAVEMLCMISTVDLRARF